jgi:deoxyribodipyrimidine photo-lyase
LPSRTSTGIVWFRRDLRLHDQPALRAAIDEHERVVPVFCFDDRLLHGRHESGARTQFLLECLVDLDAELRKRGSRLVVRHGRPERELPALAREVGARAIHLTEDVSPFARRRGELTGRALADAGVALRPHPGLNAIDVRAIETKAGQPYTVFSPFHRTWLQMARRPLLDPPGHLTPLPVALAVGQLPTLGSLGLTQEVAEPARGGEAEARAALDRFIADPVRDYAESHDALGSDQTSRLSPYLHFGCVSARAVEERLPNGEGADAIQRQLCWRDFYHHVVLNHPRNARSEFQARYRGAIRWSRARRPFEAWCEGRTGYPLVDAGMRQLRLEGWMHNRVRMVVGSFLTKHLGIDWRWGERWFMRLLIDGDEANNNGNWQWIASVGTDRQPASRRILNPARQQERYDPDHAYVRRYVRELRAVPDEYMAEPWTMPADLQRETGCVIGEDYPAPIVDHRQAREEALERYRI